MSTDTNTLSRDTLSTEKIAKALLAFILVTRYKDKIGYKEYSSYVGDELPPMSGCSLINAVCTFIDYGGEKSEAIEKFIDKNLRSTKQLEELLIYVGEKLEESGEVQTNTNNTNLERPSFLN